MPEYLTTRELAELLRIKERKVYDLAASGEVPCVRVTGKLLFPERQVREWLVGGGRGEPAAAVTLPTLFLGSHDPLLDWSIRQSRAGLATYFDGSLDGLERFVQAEGVASGLHLHDPRDGTWNVNEVARRCHAMNAVLVRFARRQRGLIVAERSRIGSLADLSDCRVVPRQEGSGAQSLFTHLLDEAGIAVASLETIAPARSESDAALAVRRGDADAAFGLEALAVEYRLGFVPLVEEEFDLLLDRRAWFEPALQRFVTFCHGDAFRRQAGNLAGYALDGLGEVRWNA